LSNAASGSAAAFIPGERPHPFFWLAKPEQAASCSESCRISFGSEHDPTALCRQLSGVRDLRHRLGENGRYPGRV
jgi:hypothetical protein